MKLMTLVQGVFYLNQAMPFGGVKASGHGRFGKSWFQVDLNFF